jgi:hypothetical protein
MSALRLFDHFDTDRPNDAPASQLRLMSIATNMVSSTIHSFERVTELDRSLASPVEVEDAPFDLETALALRAMYESCAAEAAQVLSRIDRMEKRGGHLVPGSGALRMWHGKIMAMLSVPVEEIAKGVDEALHGKLIPGDIIRNELRGRIYAGGARGTAKT